MDPWLVQQVEPQTLIMEKKLIMKKPVNLPEPPDFTGKINYGNIGHLQELWKKKGSDNFRDILNPYGEKSNYGKIGRRRRLSKLNVFFSIILSVAIYVYIYIYAQPPPQRPPSTRHLLHYAWLVFLLYIWFINILHYITLHDMTWHNIIFMYYIILNSIILYYILLYYISYYIILNDIKSKYYIILIYIVLF